MKQGSPPPTPPKIKIAGDGKTATADGFATVGSVPSISPPKLRFWEIPQAARYFYLFLTTSLGTAVFAFFIHIHSFMHTFNTLYKDFQPNVMTKAVNNLEKGFEELKKNPENSNRDNRFYVQRTDRTGGAMARHNASIGMMRHDIPEDLRTSFGLEYKPGYKNLNVCEANTSYNWPNTLTYEPVARDFFSIANTIDGLDSWCFVIGLFRDDKNKHRAFIVSKHVMNSLTLSEGEINTTMPISFRKMCKAEYSKNKNCLLLEEKYMHSATRVMQLTKKKKIPAKKVLEW